MGIRFRCDTCDKKLNVKAFLGGKRGICPHCGAKIAIPPAEGAPPVSAAPQAAHASGGTAVAEKPRTAQAIAPAEQPSPQVAANVSADPVQPAPQPAPTPAPQPQAAPADPLAEASGSVWYVRPPSGGQYGPASAEYMRRWIDEGRISGDSLVWREGWADWQSASTALGSLLGGSGPAPVPVQAPAPSALDSPVAPTGSGINAGDSSLTKRSGGSRRKKRGNTMALVWAIVLVALTLGLLTALVIVVSSQSG